MTAQVASWRASYTAGDWLVLAGPTAIVALDPEAEIGGPRIEEIWSDVLASASMDDLVARLAPLDRTVSPRLLAVFWSSEGMRTLIRGSLTLREVRSGRALADGDGVITWREVGLDEVSAAVVALPSAGGSSGQALPLVVGAVRAGSLRIDAAPEAAVVSGQLPGAPPAPADASASEPAGDARDDTDQPVEAGEPVEGGGPVEADDGDWSTGAQTQLQSDWTDDWEADGASPSPAGDPEADETGDDDAANGDTALMDPATLLAAAVAAPASSVPLGSAGAQGAAAPVGPQVDAVFCPQGHPNPPGASGCWVCGQAIHDPVGRTIARPVLARLRLPDGSTVVLDRPILIGRAPSAAEGHDDGGESPRLVTVPSPSHDISRTHVRIAPDGWQILVTDLRSTNGTSVVTPGPGIDRMPLDADQPLSVALGTLVELGDGVAVLVDAVDGSDDQPDR